MLGQFYKLGLWVGLGLSLTGWADEPKPFKRAFVFAGGSHQTASFLGMVEMATEMGLPPDVVLSTCGSSIANQILNRSKDPQVWREIIRSREFYQALKSEKANPRFAQGWPVLGVIGGNALTTLQRETNHRPQVEKIPDVFSNYLLELPTDKFPPALDVPFSTEGIRSVILAAQVDFTPEEVGTKRGNRKLLTEVFFTDPDTGRHLKGVISPTAQQFPDSSISADTLTITDVNLAPAARASISEPLLTNIMAIERHGRKTYFLAGSVDSYPVEIAKLLADEVVATRISEISSLETMIGENVHGFNMNERRKFVQGLEIDHWIDRSDTAAIEQLEPSKKLNLLDGTLLSLHSEIPDSYEKYLEIVDQHWAWGRAKMAQALKTPHNDTAHVTHDSPNGHAQGLFARLGKVVRFGWAPAVTLSTAKNEYFDDDQGLEEAVVSTLQLQGGALGAYTGTSVLLGILRSHYLESDAADLVDHGDRLPTLRITLGNAGQISQDPAPLHVTQIRANTQADLHQALLGLQGRKFARVEIVAQEKKGTLRFSDGTELDPALLKSIGVRLGEGTTPVHYVVSKLGRTQRGREQAAQITEALGGTHSVLTARAVRFSQPLTRRLGKAAVAHLSGWANLKTAARLVGTLPRAGELYQGAVVVPCEQGMGRLAP